MTQPRQLDRLLNCPPILKDLRLCPAAYAHTLANSSSGESSAGPQVSGFCLQRGDRFFRQDIATGMTYTQLKTEHCPALDTLLSGSGYISELDCGMRQWLTDGPQKGLSTPEKRAACHTLGDGRSAGIELSTSFGECQVLASLPLEAP